MLCNPRLHLGNSIISSLCLFLVVKETSLGSFRISLLLIFCLVGIWSEKINASSKLIKSNSSFLADITVSQASTHTIPPAPVTIDLTLHRKMTARPPQLIRPLFGYETNDAWQVSPIKHASLTLSYRPGPQTPVNPSLVPFHPIRIAISGISPAAVPWSWFYCQCRITVGQPIGREIPQMSGKPLSLFTAIPEAIELSTPTAGSAVILV